MLFWRFADALLEVHTWSFGSVHIPGWRCVYAQLKYACSLWLYAYSSVCMHQPQEMFLERSACWKSLSSNNLYCKKESKKWKPCENVLFDRVSGKVLKLAKFGVKRPFFYSETRKPNVCTYEWVGINHWKQINSAALVIFLYLLCIYTLRINRKK